MCHMMAQYFLEVVGTSIRCNPFKSFVEMGGIAPPSFIFSIIHLHSNIVKIFLTFSYIHDFLFLSSRQTAFNYAAKAKAVCIVPFIFI